MVSQKYHKQYDVEWGCKAHNYKAVNATTSTSFQSSGTYCYLIGWYIKQTTLLNRLTEAEAQLASTNNDMVVDEPVKPVAGSSKHPDDQEFIAESELLY